MISFTEPLSSLGGGLSSGKTSTIHPNSEPFISSPTGLAVIVIVTLLAVTAIIVVAIVVIIR